MAGINQAQVFLIVTDCPCQAEGHLTPAGQSALFRGQGTMQLIGVSVFQTRHLSGCLAHLIWMLSPSPSENIAKHLLEWVTSTDGHVHLLLMIYPI